MKLGVKKVFIWTSWIWINPSRLQVITPDKRRKHEYGCSLRVFIFRPIPCGRQGLHRHPVPSASRTRSHRGAGMLRTCHRAARRAREGYDRKMRCQHGRHCDHSGPQRLAHPDEPIRVSTISSSMITRCVEILTLRIEAMRMIHKSQPVDMKKPSVVANQAVLLAGLLTHIATQPYLASLRYRDSAQLND